MSKYRADIDGLRALAIVLVVIFHAFPSVMPNGFIGVDVFFVISGYLITGLILRAQRDGRFSLIHFYARRARRILPALFVILFFTWIAGTVLLLAPELKNLAKHILAGATFTTNLRLIHELGYFNSAAALKPLLHLWSLSVEEQFYLTWPLFLILLGGTRNKMVLIFVILIAGSFALNIYWTFYNASFAFYSVTTRYWELLAGCGLAYWETRHSVSNARIVHFLSFAGLVGLVGSLPFLNESAFPGWMAVTPIGATVLLIAAGPSGFINRNLFSNRFCIYVGRISYPWYLWHWPLLSFLRITEQGTPSFESRIAVVILSFALAAGTYHFVELRIQAVAWTNKKWLTIGAVGLIAFAILGEATNIGGGFPGRYPSLELAISKNFNDCAEEFKPLLVHCHRHGEKPFVAVLGDSRANNFYGGLTEVDRDLPSILLGAPGCPFTLGVKIESVPDCQPLNLRILQYLKAHPEIETVILVSRGMRYISDDVSIGVRQRQSPAGSNFLQWANKRPTL